MPSEKNIVMLHRAEGLFGIAKQNLASGRVRVLTQANADESPSLSPNGQMVLYATRYGGRGVLAMVSTDGRIQLRLPAREGNVQEPA
ncbi:Tol-Pal system beta propeller repeat protein TolB, partial [bacterium LRH843]|nr:Tol-Pal system beta propeller repeat protein TolB [bacterium LRH843]